MDPSGHFSTPKWVKKIGNKIKDGAKWTKDNVIEPVGMTTFLYGTNLVAEGGNPIDAYKSMTKKGQADWLLDITLGAEKGEGGIYHISQNYWQSWRYVGYNKAYDSVFDRAIKLTGNKSDNSRFTFNVGDEEYAIWVWKGDYVNLGAGNELGIYRRMKVGGISMPHWETAPDKAMPISLSLSYANGGGEILSVPEQTAWWPNGFNPQVQNNNADDFTMRATMNFSSHPDLWDGFNKKWNKPNTGWTFNESNHTAELIW